MSSLSKIVQEAQELANNDFGNNWAHSLAGEVKSVEEDNLGLFVVARAVLTKAVEAEEAEAELRRLESERRRVIEAEELKRHQLAEEKRRVEKEEQIREESALSLACGGAMLVCNAVTQVVVIMTLRNILGDPASFLSALFVIDVAGSFLLSWLMGNAKLGVFIGLFWFPVSVFSGIFFVGYGLRLDPILGVVFLITYGLPVVSLLHGLYRRAELLTLREAG